MAGPIPIWEGKNKSYFTEENIGDNLQSQVLMGQNTAAKFGSHKGDKSFAKPE